MLLEQQRKAKLNLDDDEMMYLHGYGNVTDEDVEDKKILERKRQRTFGLEDEDDIVVNTLAPIPDEGSKDE